MPFQQGGFDLFNSLGMTDPFNGSMDANTYAAYNAQNPYDNYVNQLQNFYKQLSGPVDPNDPMYQSIMASATSAAGNQNEMSGVSGPAAQQNVVGNVSAASAAYQMQRTQLAQAALQNLGQAQGMQGNWNYQQNLNKEAMANSGAQFLYQNLVPSAGNISQVLGGVFGGGKGLSSGAAAGPGTAAGMTAPSAGMGMSESGLVGAGSQVGMAGDAAGAGGTGLFGGGAGGAVADLAAA